MTSSVRVAGRGLLCEWLYLRAVNDIFKLLGDCIAAIAPGLKACVRGFGSVLRGLWRGLCRAVTFPFKCVAEICIEIYLACTKVAGVSKASRDAARAVVRTGGVGDGDRAEDPPADPRLMV